MFLSMWCKIAQFHGWRIASKIHAFLSWIKFILMVWHTSHYFFRFLQADNNKQKCAQKCSSFLWLPTIILFARLKQITGCTWYCKFIIHVHLSVFYPLLSYTRKLWFKIKLEKRWTWFYKHQNCLLVVAIYWLSLWHIFTFWHMTLEMEFFVRLRTYNLFFQELILSNWILSCESWFNYFF